jgi:hypothetical protein
MILRGRSWKYEWVLWQRLESPSNGTERQKEGRQGQPATAEAESPVHIFYSVSPHKWLQDIYENPRL